MSIRIFLISLALGFCSIVQAEIVTKQVSYKSDGTTLKGYMAWDDAQKGSRPGVLVVHEWWGHNEYARKRARMLAQMGYVALALDMYGDGKQADHPDEAGKFSSAVGKNLPLATARFKAAKKVLSDHPRVDASNIAAIGYCFGGGIVLQMARSGIDLKGVASFHGSLYSAHPAKPNTVKAKVLVLHGAEDPFIKPEHLDGFKVEMKQAGVDYRLVSYPGAKHSFTNPAADQFGKKFNLPLAYNADADRKSWKELQVFLADVFSQE